MEDRQAVKEAVRARIDIVELVGRYVRLRAQGNNHVGLCPFHEERTPSFTVSPSLGVFHCFGCGASGDVFEFVERVERLNFPQALEFLAQQAGIPLSRHGRPSPELQLRELNERVVGYFQEALASTQGSLARAYLQQRGIDDASVRKFRLGFAPPGWQNLMNAFASQHQALKALGLLSANEQGKMYDRFRDRLMFPLCDPHGQALGFAGRQLQPDERSPKYVNTPTTPLLKKGMLLYGAHLAKETARQADVLVLVEGYTDVIAAHQRGLCNVVASMGTALTDAQARLCVRLAKRVVLAFDQDAAGQKATLRGIQALLEAGLQVHMTQWAPGMDPDAFIQQNGVDAFSALLREARPFFETYVETLCRQHDASRFEGKQQILAAALPFLKELSNLHWRHYLVRGLSSALGLPEEEIEREARRGHVEVAAGPNAQGQPQNVERLSLEEQLLCFLLQGHLSVERATAELEMEDFARYGEVWEALQGCFRQHGTLQLDSLHRCVDKQWHALLNQLSVMETRAESVSQDVEDVLRHCKRNRLEHKIRSLQAQIRQAEGVADRAELQQLQLELVQAHRLKQEM